MNEDQIKALAERASIDVQIARETKSKPRAAARTFVSILLATHPRVKLPEVMSLAQTGELMNSTGATKAMIGEELKLARRTRKQNAEVAGIVVPPRPRSRAKRQEPPVLVATELSSSTHRAGQRSSPGKAPAGEQSALPGVVLDEQQPALPGVVPNGPISDL